MRVFYFLTKSEQGGAQSVVYELLRAHKTRGDEAVVMAQGNGWLAAETRTLGFSYIENPFMRKTYNPRTLLRAARTYRSAVRSVLPDVVSVHSSFSGFIGRVFRIAGIPVVYTAHGWGFVYGKRRKWLNKLGERYAARSTDALVCVSQSDKAIALRNGIIAERKIFVIHNGVDIDVLASKKISSIVFVGRFAWPKQQRVLIEAFALLPQSLREKYRVVCIGGGSELDDAKEKAKTLNVSQSITFTGDLPRDEALAVMSSATISVLISNSEGFPMSVIESLQLGLPVIANDVGGIKEAVDDSVGRILPPAPNAPAVANALTELLSDDERLGRLSLAAKERGKLFSAEHMSTEVFALYERLTKIYE